MRNWLEEWKQGEAPELPGLYAIASSSRLETILFVGAAHRSIREESQKAECPLGNVLSAISIFHPGFALIYWPCPNEISIIGQLPGLSEKLITALEPKLNLINKRLPQQVQSVEAELLV